MADDLNASQLAALSGPMLDKDKITVALQLVTPGGNVDIKSRVIRLNSTTCQLFNWNKKRGLKIRWPSVQWTVSNGDGYFSPANPSSIWGAYTPYECSLLFFFLLSDPNKVLLNDTFPIQRVEQIKDRGIANIYATTNAASLLSKEQSREDMRWEVDFDTNSITQRRGDPW